MVIISKNFLIVSFLKEEQCYLYNISKQKYMKYMKKNAIYELLSKAILLKLSKAFY